MANDYESFQRGYRVGVRRVAEELKLAEVEVPGDQVELAMTIVSDSSPDLNPRFVETFAQLVAIAHVCRLHYQEPALGANEVTAYLAHSISFLNSWTHV